MSNKGFGLLEMCVVIGIISGFVLFVPVDINVPSFDYYIFDEYYLYMQTSAMRYGEERRIDEYQIRFNQKGNIDRARTITFSDGHCLIAELGGGRLAFK